MEESNANLPPVSGWGSHTQMLRALDQQHAGREILRAVREMPETWQQVFLLVVVEELTYEEVATALGCAVGTVASKTTQESRNVLTYRGEALMLSASSSNVRPPLSRRANTSSLIPARKIAEYQNMRASSFTDSGPRSTDCID